MSKIKKQYENDKIKDKKNTVAVKAPEAVAAGATKVAPSQPAAAKTAVESNKNASSSP